MKRILTLALALISFSAFSQQTDTTVTNFSLTGVTIYNYFRLAKGIPGAGKVWVDTAGNGTGAWRTLNGNTGSSATSLTLTVPAINSNYYLFTGSSNAVWTLPTITGNFSKILEIKSKGAGQLTIQRTGSDLIYDGGTVTNYVLLTGDAVKLVNDGTNWVTF